jgi:hypothetical protein
VNQLNNVKGEKKLKKSWFFEYNVLKKCVTLHRFSKANISITDLKSKEK